MLNRLFNLVVLQIGDRFAHKNGKKSIMPFLFKCVGFLAIGAITFLIFMLMEKVIYLKPTNSMVLFIIFISQVITLVSNAMELTESLYGSKDNAILLSLPALHNEIFISKLIVFYIIEFISNVTFMLPILIGFGLYTGQDLAFYLLSILISVVLPLVSVLIGALISIPLSLIKKLFKRVSILYVFLFVALLVVLFYFSKIVVSGIPNPLHFMALYNYIVKLVLAFIDSVNEYALFYKWFGNLIFSINGWLNLLYITLLTIGLIVLNIFLSWPIFFKLASNSSESAVMKKHEGENKEAKTTFQAFFKKEILISFRTLGNVINNYAMVVFMPLILYLIDSLFYSFDLSLFGHDIVFGFNILVGFLLLSSSNSASASSLSEEGSEFILLKTSPVDTKLIAWAKILNNSLVSLFIIIASTITLAFMNVFEIGTLIEIMVAIIILDFGHILWSFQLDLRNPQIKDVALTGKISNKKNITQSLTLGVVIAIIFGALAIVLSLVKLEWLFFVLCIGFTVWRYFVFKGNLNVYFYEIEL